MNGAEYHLLLNHLPVVGSLFAFGVLVVGLKRANETIVQVGLVLFLVSALTAIPTYLTGSGAAQVASQYPGASAQRIEEHEDSASWALGLILALGGLSIAALKTAAAKPQLSRRLTQAVVGLGVVNLAVMSYAAHLGGEIRHPEIRPPGQQDAPPAAGEPAH